MFHRVEPNLNSVMYNKKSLNIDPMFLSHLIDMLRSKGYKILSLDGALQHLKNGCSGKFVCLTFDDGYRDNYEYVYKICEEKHAPFTVYVSSGFIEGDSVAWWLGLSELIEKNDLIELSMNGVDESFVIETIEQKNATYPLLKKIFLGLNKEEQLNLCQQIKKKYKIDFVKITKDSFLSWAQVKEMSNSGLVEIGSHTVNHPAIIGLKKSEILREIENDVATLNEKIAGKVKHFAYPFGSPDAASDREYKICKDIGFKTCVTTIPGSLAKESLDALESLPRYSISGHQQDMQWVDFCLSGAYSFFWKIKQRIRSGGGAYEG